MDLRFFEIYRSGEYLGLILGGALTSLGLTVVAGIAGFVFAVLLAFLRFKKVPVLEGIADTHLPGFFGERMRRDEGRPSTLGELLSALKDACDEAEDNLKLQRL